MLIFIQIMHAKKVFFLRSNITSKGEKEIEEMQISEVSCDEGILLRKNVYMSVTLRIEKI